MLLPWRRPPATALRMLVCRAAWIAHIAIPYGAESSSSSARASRSTENSKPSVNHSYFRSSSSCATHLFSGAATAVPGLWRAWGERLQPWPIVLREFNAVLRRINEDREPKNLPDLQV